MKYQTGMCVEIVYKDRFLRTYDVRWNNMTMTEVSEEDLVEL